MSGDEALLIYAKYVKQVVNEFLCVFVRYGVPPFHDPTTNEWIYDFREMLPRKLTPSGKNLSTDTIRSKWTRMLTPPLSISYQSFSGILRN